MHSTEEARRLVGGHTTIAGDLVDDEIVDDGEEAESRHLLAGDAEFPSHSSISGQTRQRPVKKKRRNDSMESTEDKKFDSIIHASPDDQLLSTKKSTRYRWIVIFILSISGDGWSYEASVMSSVLNMPQFISRQCYPSQLDYMVDAD